jgi:hypothetical protein
VPDNIAQLELQRQELLAQFCALNDFRPGSVTGIVRRCGKPTCHCAQADDPGHGPNLRLTYKVQSKTVSEALSTPAAVRKAEREIGEFRNFQQLSHEFVEVNTRLCRLRPVEEEPQTAQEKKRPKPSARKSRAK